MNVRKRLKLEPNAIVKCIACNDRCELPFCVGGKVSVRQRQLMIELGNIFPEASLIADVLHILHFHTAKTKRTPFAMQ